MGQVSTVLYNCIVAKKSYFCEVRHVSLPENCVATVITKHFGNKFDYPWCGLSEQLGVCQQSSYDKNFKTNLARYGVKMNRPILNRLIATTSQVSKLSGR